MSQGGNVAGRLCVGDVSHGCQVRAGYEGSPPLARDANGNKFSDRGTITDVTQEIAEFIQGFRAESSWLSTTAGQRDQCEGAQPGHLKCFQ